MRIVVFDTETTSLDKPFCYNIGYAIYETETQECLIAKEFIIEQVWHSRMLFESAYYADKKPLYINRMRSKKILMDKFGYVMQEMIRDFKAYKVEQAYAYNSNFDERVISYNCEWFKCNNPFDNIPLFDIRGYVHKAIAYTKEYLTFAETHKLFTESGNYSTTAEAVTKYISGNAEFEEEHTALADTEIEAKILFECIAKGCEYGKAYTVYRSIVRDSEKVLTVDHKGTKYEFAYKKRTNMDKGNRIILK